MAETIKRCTIRARRNRLAKDGVFGYLTLDDRCPTHIASRGSIAFHSPEEIRAAIRELRSLLPVVDQLAGVPDGP